MLNNTNRSSLALHTRQLMLLSKLSRIGRKEQPSELAKYPEQLECTAEEVRRLASDVSKNLHQHALFNKHNKKTPEHRLVLGLKEAVDKSGGQGSLFQNVLQETTDVLNTLVTVRGDFEARLEKDIVDSLNKLSEEVCASITKARRNLNKVSNETRFVREQLLKANISSQSRPTDVQSNSSGSSTTLNADSDSSRLTALQNQVDEKERELSTCKELLLRELYTFAAQEDTYALLLVKYLQFQEAYLEESLQLLRGRIPELLTFIQHAKPTNVFGCHLTKHLSQTGRQLSYVLETCINRLNTEAVLQEEGLFRRSGAHRRMDVLVKALNLQQADDSLLDACDSMVITGALKQYLSSLPEPLITFTLAERWAEASKTPGMATVDVVAKCLEDMPADFRLNLAYLCLFLSKVAAFSNVNKMTADNLAIVIGPNLFRLEPNDTLSEKGSVNDRPGHSLELFGHSGAGIHLTDILIQNAEKLFAKDKANLPSLITAHTIGHNRSASATTLTDMKPTKPPESYRKRTESPDGFRPPRPLVIHPHSEGNEHENIVVQSSSESIHYAKTTTSGSARKKSAAPRPPVPPPPTSSPNQPALKPESTGITPMIAVDPPTLATEAEENLPLTSANNVLNSSSTITATCAGNSVSVPNPGTPKSPQSNGLPVLKGQPKRPPRPASVYQAPCEPQPP
ncbi:hypothetical protein CRM22_003342 [Opisthorchis felineus]|uniref:Rho-GAP domain-containing protein n=1 Tax=Opisthorchis felineus TaxID=147828 RepID=A0A4S2M1P7_OPIFE|nr:hypothetical protein CRM22_003342 [Opisthorchis felineus]